MSHKKSNDRQIAIDIEEDDENDGNVFDSDDEHDGKSSVCFPQIWRNSLNSSTLFQKGQTWTQAHQLKINLSWH